MDGPNFFFQELTQVFSAKKKRKRTKVPGTFDIIESLVTGADDKFDLATR